MKNMFKNSVFALALIISLIIIGYGAIDSQGLANIASNMLAFINNNFAWFFLLTLPIIMGLLIYFALGKYGDIKLGDDCDKPEHSNLSWFAMLFCGGTGIGLVFWSIAEPLTQYVNPIKGIEPGTEEAARFAIRTCYLHWGFLPWTCFAIVGLGLAYFQFRKKKNGLISNLLTPLIGEKLVTGWVGKIVDTFAVLVTVAGVATSLGLGCMQISGGLEYIFGIRNNKITWLILIAIVTVIFVFASISGIGKGIKILSNINSYLAIALLVICFLIGPINTSLNTLVVGLGDHIANFISDSFLIFPQSDNSWIFNWRVFYWAWWIAWAPFVGMFIARISKGRTIREFILGVMIIPSLCTFIWFAVFGAMTLDVTGNWNMAELANIAASPETAVFVIFEKYPMGQILSVMTIVLLALFFITSANSATFSLSMMSSDGDLNPSNWKKAVWGVVCAAMAFVLLCSGGLKPLQTISIAAALPFLVIMVMICISLVKSFSEEKKNN